ncbi:MAG: transposase zinc-binding domain-containing protein [Methanophagales archaeon]|nr:transposase zinc-binding domain-containing protein [Methanophagales archaeon]MCW7070462.1 transposase zinc-binding domain-containing protein [Methanophagales archaeon]
MFTDNHNWDRDRYSLLHRGEIREVEKREVEKMMSCKGPDRGCFVYYSPKCGEYREISLGCNNRLCSDCGKRYTTMDKGAYVLKWYAKFIPIP